MKYKCYTCHSDIDITIGHCTKCGHILFYSTEDNGEISYCEHCDIEIKSGDSHCSKCVSIGHSSKVEKIIPTPKFRYLYRDWKTEHADGWRDAVININGSTQGVYCKLQVYINGKWDDVPYVEA